MPDSRPTATVSTACAWRRISRIDWPTPCGASASWRAPGSISISTVARPRSNSTGQVLRISRTTRTRHSGRLTTALSTASSSPAACSTPTAARSPTATGGSCAPTGRRSPASTAPATASPQPPGPAIGPAAAPLVQPRPSPAVPPDTSPGSLRRRSEQPGAGGEGKPLAGAQHHHRGKHSGPAERVGDTAARTVDLPFTGPTDDLAGDLFDDPDAGGADRLADRP